MTDTKTALAWTIEAMLSSSEAACFNAIDPRGNLIVGQEEWFAELAFLQVWGSVYHTSMLKVMSNPETGATCTVCGLYQKGMKYSDCPGVRFSPQIVSIVSAQKAWVREKKVYAVTKPLLTSTLTVLKKGFEIAVAADKYSWSSVASYA